MSTHRAHQFCAWCGSNDTRFQHFRCWEEDERGNEITTTDINSQEYTPREEIWWCNNCDGGFIVPLEGDDYPELPADFIPPEALD